MLNLRLNILGFWCLHALTCTVAPRALHSHTHASSRLPNWYEMYNLRRRFSKIDVLPQFFRRHLCSFMYDTLSSLQSLFPPLATAVLDSFIHACVLMQTGWKLSASCGPCRLWLCEAGVDTGLLRLHVCVQHWMLKMCLFLKNSHASSSATGTFTVCL